MEIKRYNFIDLIRLVSMMGVVWAHIYIPVEVHNTNFIFYQILIMQFWKFGVINFFMISGFLLKEKLDFNNKIEYLKNRLRTILKPYLIALTIVILITYISSWLKGTLGTTYLSELIKDIIFGTAYWFIPNYFICLIVILLSNKLIKSFYFGGILFLITICFSYSSVYIKASYLPHTQVFFGYIFFLWLGYHLNNKILITFLIKIKSYKLYLFFVIVFLTACVESYILNKNGYSSNFSVLRFGNIFYSIAAYILFINLFSKPYFHNKFLNLRKNTYYVYLYHLVIYFKLNYILLMFKRLFINGLNLDFPKQAILLYLAQYVFMFLITYFGTNVLVDIFNKLKLKYIKY